MVLALLVERAGGAPYHELVRRHVLEPAGMADTAFLRSDELPATAARGYLARGGLRTNVLHLPVVGVGDGGAYSTAADLHRLWQALHSGRIVSPDGHRTMMTPRSDWPEESRRYGLGFHRHATGGSPRGWRVTTPGCPSSASTSRGKTSPTPSSPTGRDGAWPIVNLLNQQLGL